MKQYNRIMLGAGGMFLEECLQGSYIGANFIKDDNLVDSPWNDEALWRLQMQERYLALHPEKTMGTARNSVGFLWTICKGLNNGDIVLASDGHGGYHVGKVSSGYYYQPSDSLSHRRRVEWLNIVISRQSMSQKLQNSTGSIGTCCNITKYAEEIERLNRAFGIGVIKLSPYADGTQILYPARKNELDYYTIDKLCRINPDFRTFMTKSTKVLNVTENAVSDVKESLQRYCDKGFTSTEELMVYCNDNHIPC